MLLKWVTCRTSDRAAFGLGQRAWSALRGVPGFRGQCGGWGRSAAQIFGFWDDRAGYQAFMDGSHDRIAGAQAGTYREIEVRLLDRLLDIGPGFPAEAGGVLRLAHCHVRPGGVAAFVRAQVQVWNPGMSAAPGMLGGVVAQLPAASADVPPAVPFAVPPAGSEFVVLSAWRAAGDHRAYQDEIFPALRAAAAVHADGLAVTGDLIEIDPAWSVSA